MYEGIQERGGLYSSCNAYGFASPVPDTTRLQYKLVATLQRDYITVRAGSSFTATRVRRPTNRKPLVLLSVTTVVEFRHQEELSCGAAKS